ncbi:MAG: IMP dehydrogenase [Alphaproteobacteria bacterium]|nr:IMP dehydrogenase [Alphaproteobacteria bacterium]
MTQLLSETCLDYSDILIKPKMGINLNSRKDVGLQRDFKFKHGQKRTGLGVFNANMATVGNFAIVKKLLAKGMFATLHKFYTAEEIGNFLQECEKENISTDNLFITIGLRNFPDHLQKLKDIETKYGWKKNQNISIEAPNFYIPQALENLKKTRDAYPNAVIMAGNIASSDICLKLLDCADIIKCGIGSGSACLTRKQTGCGTPMVSLILECADIVHSVNGHICADGGIVEVGDICKAFCLNSDFVMAGGIFAGTDEAEGTIVTKYKLSNEVMPRFDSFGCKTAYDPIVQEQKFKQYFGMSSEYANKKYAGGMDTYKTSEGRELLIPYTGTLDHVLQDITGGIASCCTYIGADTVKSMSKCATLIKVHNQLNRVFEQYTK